MSRTRQSEDAQAGKKAWKVALYIRLSKEDGHDESLSVINQRKLLMEFMERFDDDYSLFDTYIDDGLTGTDYDRPGFQRMLDDIENNAVNCVVVKDLARLFRNYADQGYFLENFFPRNNVRFISLGLPQLDSYKQPEMMNSIAVPIQGIINDNHCRETSVKVRAVFDMKRRKGEFIGAFAAYGYQKNPDDRNRLIIDVQAAEVVKNIYHWYVNQGYSKLGIAKKLNSLLVPNPSAYKKQNGQKYHNPHTDTNDGLWSSGTVASILKNQVYIGNMVQGRYRIKSYKIHTQVKAPENEWFIVPDTHEPIISREAFEKAQELGQRDTRTAPDQKQVYLFSGLLCCADCHKAMTRKSAKDKVYYACRTYTQKSKEKCMKHSIREDLLATAVLATIQKQIDRIASLPEIIEEIKRFPSANARSASALHMLKLRTQELEKTLQMQDALYIDWKNGDIDKEQHHRLRVKLENQAAKLQAAIANIQEECRGMEAEIQNDHPDLTSFLKHKNILQLNRTILITLVDVIYIHQDKSMTIHFKFCDPHDPAR